MRDKNTDSTNVSNTEEIEVLKLRSKELEDLIFQKENQIYNLLQDKERLVIASNHYKSIMEDMNRHLEIIYSSNGWRMLSKYYKIRDAIHLPRWKKRKSNSQIIGNEKASDNEMVSIIIPVYNNAKYLKQCIQSAINQTYTNFEVVVVDDCSSDKEVSPILESFNNFPNYKYYKNDYNSGISATMNHAIIKADGEWIAFLDCDDWLDPDAIKKLMDCLKSKPGAVYGYSDRLNEFEIDGCSKIETFRNRPTENYFKELLIGMYTSHLKIISKEVFLKIGLHESRFDGAQDYDIALKTAFYFGDAFAYLSEPVYHHRIHEKQTTIESSRKIEYIVSNLKNEARSRMDIRQGKLNKFVSFVILSFEKKEMTLQCVEAIKNTVKVPHEVIVFDNASSYETVSFLKNNVESIENVKMVYSENNLGCPGGRRKATQLAQGDYIINLDNDIIVTDGWIEELIVRAESSQKVGAVCCKTVFPNGKVQFNGGSYVVKEDFISFYLTDIEKSEKDSETAMWHECGWVPGGATLFKREVVKELDYSEGYINAFEDNDVALQISRMGYKMFNCPSAKVYHHHIMHDSEQVNKEKDYMKVRYNSEGFIQSLVNFYIRNKLIINDPFVYRLMNMEGLNNEQKRKKIKELSEERIDS
jgi:GT2 family glycosyltransferase